MLYVLIKAEQCYPMEFWNRNRNNANSKGERPCKLKTEHKVEQQGLKLSTHTYTILKMEHKSEQC